MVRALAGDVHDPRNHHMTQSVVFGLIVFGVFIVFLGLNFVLIGLDVRARGRPIAPAPGDASSSRCCLGSSRPARSRRSSRSRIRTSGLPVLFAAIAVLLIFRHLTVALLRSEDRAEQLEARSRQLVGLQLGVLTTLVRALGMRDKTTGRHAAAVARYARGLGDRARLQRGGTGHGPHCRAAPRDRQVHLARPRPACRGRPDEDLAIVKQPPAGGGDPRRRARRLWAGRRRDPLPPRARRRRRLPGRV